MKGTRLLLARHAETSAPDRFHGAESDIGLSEWGARQAELLGQSLRTPARPPLYSSAMRRAVDTAAAVGRACALEPIAIAGLHERKIGPLSGLSREEGWATYAASKERWIAGDLEHTHPGGESYADIRRRVVPIFERLAARHPGETIIVVAHGVVIRVVLTTLVPGFATADFDRIAIDFASVNELLSTVRPGRQVTQPVRRGLAGAAGRLNRPGSSSGSRLRLTGGVGNCTRLNFYITDCPKCGYDTTPSGWPDTGREDEALSEFVSNWRLAPSVRDAIMVEAVHLRRGLLPPPHHFPHGHVAQQVAQAGVGPQTGNNLGWLTQLGEEARPGARPRAAGPRLRGGPDVAAPATRCPRSGPCRRRNRTPGSCRPG